MSQIHPREARQPPPRLLGFGGSSCLAPGAASAHACVDIPNCLSAAGEFRNFARHRSNKRVISVCACVMLSRPGNMQLAPFSLFPPRFCFLHFRPLPPSIPPPHPLHRHPSPSRRIPVLLLLLPLPQPVRASYVCVCVCARRSQLGGCGGVCGRGKRGGVGDRGYGVASTVSLHRSIHLLLSLCPAVSERKGGKKHATLPILFSAHLHPRPSSPHSPPNPPRHPLFPRLSANAAGFLGALSACAALAHGEPPPLPISANSSHRQPL